MRQLLSATLLFFIPLADTNAQANPYYYDTIHEIDSVKELKRTNHAKFQEWIEKWANSAKLDTQFKVALQMTEKEVYCPSPSSLACMYPWLIETPHSNIIPYADYQIWRNVFGDRAVKKNDNKITELVFKINNHVLHNDFESLDLVGIKEVRRKMFGPKKVKFKLLAKQSMPIDFDSQESSECNKSINSQSVNLKKGRNKLKVKFNVPARSDLYIFSNGEKSMVIFKN